MCAKTLTNLLEATQFCIKMFDDGMAIFGFSIDFKIDFSRSCNYAYAVNLTLMITFGNNRFQRFARCSMTSIAYAIAFPRNPQFIALNSCVSCLLLRWTEVMTICWAREQFIDHNLKHTSKHINAGLVFYCHHSSSPVSRVLVLHILIQRWKICWYAVQLNFICHNVVQGEPHTVIWPSVGCSTQRMIPNFFFLLCSVLCSHHRGWKTHTEAPCSHFTSLAAPTNEKIHTRIAHTHKHPLPYSIQCTLYTVLRYSH